MTNLINKYKLIQKVEYLIFISFLYALLKISIPFNNVSSYRIIDDLMIAFLFVIWFTFFRTKLENKKENVISIILNLGIVISLIFLVYSIINNVLNYFLESNDLGISIKFISTVLITLQIIAISFILSVLKLFHGLKQKKENIKQFNLMMIFMVVSSLTSYNILSESKQFLDPVTLIQTICYSGTFLLIALSSLKVSWIAFLSKKQKISLLLISVVLSILFIICSTYVFSEFDNAEQFSSYFSNSFRIFSGFILVYGAVNFTVVFFTALFHLPTADAFDRKAEEVSTLMDLSKLITQVFDFKDLAETITEVTNRICNADISWLITNNKGELEVISVNNISFVDAEKISEKIDFSEGSLKNLTTYTDKDIFVSGGISKEIKTLIVAPLMLHEKTNGYLIVARLNEINFDKEEEKAIRAFADYASVALENALLLERSIEKERLEKELDVAREIQYKIIPTVLPRLDNLSLDSSFIPAFEVGGDYYDFFELHNNQLGFVIADVSGKGIQAAFIMSEIKGIFESLSKECASPKEVLIKANKILCKSLDKKSFVTAIYGTIDFENKVLKVARAGHTPLIYANDSGIKEVIPKGMGLGLNSYGMFETTLEEETIELKDNDLIVLYTDGITEAKNSSGEDFGESRLNKIIKNNLTKSVENITNEIIKNVSIYSKNNSQHDDITLVVMRYKK